MTCSFVGTSPDREGIDIAFDSLSELEPEMDDSSLESEDSDAKSQKENRGQGQDSVLVPVVSVGGVLELGISGRSKGDISALRL